MDDLSRSSDEGVDEEKVDTLEAVGVGGAGSDKIGPCNVEIIYDDDEDAEDDVLDDEPSGNEEEQVECGSVKL